MKPIDDDDTTLESRFRSAAAMISAHGDVNEVLHGRGVSVRANASSRPNRYFVGYAAAAGLVLVLGGLVAIGNRNDAPEATRAHSPSTTTVTEPTNPELQLPIRGVKYATAMTSHGVVDLYDSPETGEKCFTLALADGSDLADCFPNESVDDGTAYVYLRMRPKEPGLLIGLTDPDSNVHVEIGDSSTEPGEHGIWVAEVPDGTDTFIVETVDGAQTFPIQQPG
jgi:hypothetical protein